MLKVYTMSSINARQLKRLNNRTNFDYDLLKKIIKEQSSYKVLNVADITIRYNLSTLAKKYSTQSISSYMKVLGYRYSSRVE